MFSHTIVFTIFIIFTGAAVFATLMLYTRQSLLIAYMLLGAILGPWGLQLITDAEVVKQIGDVGIIFLLFLLGLHLQPQNLWHMLKKATWIAVISSLVFVGMGYAVCRYFGFTVNESLIVGAAIMFSSTIIGLKLLPTTILHHQHTGEVMISVLLMQDLIAIVLLLILQGASSGGFSISDLGLLVVALPALLGFSYLMERFVLVKLIAKFDRTQEYIFLLSIGWCLGMAELAQFMGLSEEIGAFIAGVSLAASPISLYIAESLKPLRDFFLVMFFFSIGAQFNFHYLPMIVWPSLLLAGLILVVKPLLFNYLLRYSGEKKSVSMEVGMRLGQASEFSLLVAGLAASSAMIGVSANFLIQATTMLTFFVSSYIIVLKYPTPMALSEKMRRD